MEPLSVGVHSVANIGQIKAMQTVAVFGAGPVGLACMAVAKAMGAKRVIAIDIVQPRLEFAKGYAASDIFNSSDVKMNEGEKRMDWSKRVVEVMKEKLGLTERGETAVDLVVDATGAEVCIQMGFYLVKAGGAYESRSCLFGALMSLSTV
jgi:D-xylulose reductase